MRNLSHLFSEHWKPINPEEKKRYDREFLLRFQFISASMHKPEGLPHITDVVLDKVDMSVSDGPLCRSGPCTPCWLFLSGTV